MTQEELQSLGREAGLDLLRAAPADPFAETERVYLERHEAGLLGEMRWITPERIRRGCVPEELLPGARSILIGAVSYLTESSAVSGRTGPRGKVARYALGDDYHDTVKTKLQVLHRALEVHLGVPVRSRISVDSGPVVDRAVAARAGLGWYGKNTNILTPRLGSWVLLGAMLVDVPLPYSEPSRKSCGSCTRCMTACPTGALIAPGVLDSRRCISYLTIELKGPIPRELRPLIGNWIFGCDLCQEVCPVNREAPVPSHPEHRARPAWGHEPDLVELMGLSDDGFRARFRNSPVKRTKRRGLLRNVAVALGNSGDPQALPALVHALNDHEPLVRGHVAWALGQFPCEASRCALEAALGRETDPWVREEIAASLATTGVAA
ncbi:MAG: tRNA epoxyqueuosine(34) reductase QueG [Chloroflexota bacterium]|nr:tRNA epoxyqueuosine(34) reductase QueG [Chloroflexota bacterium]